MGNIYGVEPDYWKNAIHADLIFQIAAAKDTVKKFHFLYAPMGAWLHRIDLDYPAIDENSAISFTLPGAEDAKTEVSVLKYKGTGKMELIDHSTTSVEVDNISDLTASGYDLYALVTNRHISPPYTDKTSVRLNVRVQRRLNPTGCYVVVRDIDGEFLTEYSDSSTSQSSETHSSGFPKEQGATIEFTGTTLTQMHDHVGTDGNHYVGSTTVTFDATFQNVLSFSAIATISKGDWTRTSTLSGQNIPLDSEASGMVFKVNGATTCGKITGMTWSDQYSTYTKTLLPGWTCNEESEIEVWVFTD
jgi:hypothetical protein